ncbi:Hypothetical predicted protein [Podarcis lilfordi]|uniref:Uncharacterized protein n=1 Tax=Podarcis lilfordi TaxID=74358 RepID=A0AA35KI87_9SAUR|nr:Hypothetical predicted protein [Podarcis lilfordi]
MNLKNVATGSRKFGEGGVSSDHMRAKLEMMAAVISSKHETAPILYSRSGEIDFAKGMGGVPSAAAANISKSGPAADRLDSYQTSSSSAEQVFTTFTGGGKWATSEGELFSPSADGKGKALPWNNGREKRNIAFRTSRCLEFVRHPRKESMTS